MSEQPENANAQSKPPKLEKSDAIALWQYFSSRADESGSTIKAIIFAAANAGGLIAINHLVNSPNEEIQLPCGSLRLIALAGLCFVVTAIITFYSWMLQKKKSQDRRSDVVKYAADEELLLTLEKIMDGESKAQKRYENSKNHPAQERQPNKWWDKAAMCFLTIGYLLFSIVAWKLSF